ncbi:transcription factor HBP-1b(c38)-like isoform X1 [Senna tora]|uniref:Transcription factor HBP-1b(C38)-like isoform X1 n=1 Tax=Senna tora TaxID=362788 RepID=A0A834SW30_9FABA|nr:transcription factor HBP-1b(c38)-like isoform X1 [Senna tora]
MQSFKTVQSNSPQQQQQQHQQQLYCHPSFFLRGELGELHHSESHFHQEDAVDLSSNSMFTVKSSNVAVLPINLQYGALNSVFFPSFFLSKFSLCFPFVSQTLSLCEQNTGSSEFAGCLDTGQQHLMYHRGGPTAAAAAGAAVHIENWGDSGMVENSQHTDTSTDIDVDDKNQCNRVHGLVGVDSMDQLPKGKPEDQKTLRRLAQNREAARKSRLRKKAYVQQLENSRLRLAQLEQELQRARQQGMHVGTGFAGDHGRSMVGNGALAFDMDYARWVDEHQQLINDLRSAVNSQMGDNDLHLIVEGVMAHYDEVFRLKSVGAKADVIHMLYGMWKTPAERCFMWLGGFRSSELLKIVRNHLEPLTEQQLMGIYNLQQSSLQAEDALTQGMDALQQSLMETLSSTSLGPTGTGNVADYMGQMAIAMGKLATLENFLHQADLLRQQTLQQLQKILTTRQAARALLVINDYVSRLRALSSLWLARPRE